MAYSRKYYIANRERMRAAQRAYYQRTRATRLAKQKKYDDEHREEIKLRRQRQQLKADEQTQ